MRALSAVTQQSVAKSEVVGAALRAVRPAAPAAVQRTASNQAIQRQLIQAKLSISQPGDRFEQEADRVAAAVMRAPMDQVNVGEQPSGERIQRLCTTCDEELQRQVTGDDVDEQGLVEEEEEDENAVPEEVGMLKRESASTVPASKSVAAVNTPGTGGHPLDAGVRHFMEQRIGQDFSEVRIHRDTESAQSACQLGAYAYTVGRHIYFNSGQYNPESHGGRQLLAHELTHVVQQGAASKSTNTGIGSVGQQMVQRVPCPPEFCRPFPSRRAALSNRDSPPDPAIDAPLLVFASAALAALGMPSSRAETILAGIALRVDPRVVPLWRQHIFGGRGPQDLSRLFAADFASSTTTTSATRFLVGAISADLALHPPAFPRRSSSVNINMTRRLRASIRELGDPSSRNHMNFSTVNTVPGNIAGGIGTDQLSVRTGALPSPFNDSRTARVRVRVVRGTGGTLTVTPSITYIVRDTIDLCPGDCGADQERIATVPISRWEASGISGDVPYTVRYQAPPIAPFVLSPASPPTPATGTPPTTPGP